MVPLMILTEMFPFVTENDLGHFIKGPLKCAVPGTASEHRDLP